MSVNANPDLLDDLGNSPLMHACANGHDPSARMLIKAGAFAGRVNSRGETGLHLAARHGSLGCIRELLAASCPVNCADQRGLTPILIASITNQVNDIVVQSRSFVNYPVSSNSELSPILVCSVSDSFPT